MEEIKERMTRYWSRRVEQFAALRRREHQGDKGVLWLEELQSRLGSRRGLRILDIGTGTGFFALLLAQQGHQVTGIDLTEEMIDQARHMAGELGVAVEFCVMDGENPDFAPHSFDAIVTRNLTWTLPNLPKAYGAWHRLLRPGGVLVNFDGDYCREEPHPLPANHAHRDIGAGMLAEYERMKQLLRPTQRPRPQWDEQLLRQAGFRHVEVDHGVWQRIYAEKDEFYNPTPVFAITAIA